MRLYPNVLMLTYFPGAGGFDMHGHHHIQG